MPTLSASQISSQAFSNLADNLSAEANSGNLLINTNSLSIANGASIRASNATFGNGNGGDITINATDSISIDGETIAENQEETVSSGIFASILNSETIGNSGNIEINTPQLSITDQAQVNAFTGGQEDAGSITLNVSQLTLTNGDINTITTGQGNAGSIDINANEFIELSNNSSINAGTVRNSTGNSSNLNINTKRLNLSSSSKIIATTSGQGNAGNLTVEASEFINLSGISDINGRSGLFASALAEDGNGGNLQLSTGNLTISDGAIVSVSNFPSVAELSEPGTGEAGNLTVEADSLSIEDGGRIDAATQTGNGGNITLNIAENINLRNTGLISARALRDANGGNVDIDTDLIIAFPQGNNDIVATAQRGNGGNINISAQSLFGIQQRPLSNSTNDINASSEFSLDGTVEINNPAVDPTTGLINLPASVGDASDQISQNPCEQGAGSEFTITGKGGLPPTVSESVNSESAKVSLIEPLPSARRGKQGDGETRRKYFYRSCSRSRMGVQRSR